MSIDQIDKIDGIGIDPDKGELVILISDHLPWNDENRHLDYLESKLAAYLNFIRSGDHLITIPAAEGMPICIRLVHQYIATPSVQPILQAVSAQLSAMNIRFSCESLPSGY